MQNAWCIGVILRVHPTIESPVAVRSKSARSVRTFRSSSLICGTALAGNQSVLNPACFLPSTAMSRKPPARGAGDTRGNGRLAILSISGILKSVASGSNRTHFRSNRTASLRFRRPARSVLTWRRFCLQIANYRVVIDDHQRRGRATAIFPFDAETDVPGEGSASLCVGLQ